MTVGAGTLCTTGPINRLVRGNPQWPGILDLFSESKFSLFTSFGFESAIYPIRRTAHDSDV